MAQLRLHPDRALPAGDDIRAVARRIYQSTQALPLLCMHGHVDAAVFADDEPFTDPAQLLVVPDHYVTRMLVSQGVRLEELGVPRVDGGAVERDPRQIWRRFCAHWHLFRGTPSRYWLEHEIVEVLKIDVAPGPDTADLLYDLIEARLAEPGFRPQALLDTFNIELISTTDPATSTLDDHARLAAAGLGARVIPTFRPDALTHVDSTGWTHRVQRLQELSGVDTGDYDGFVAALRHRREAFLQAGARATDHGHLTAAAEPLPPAEARRIYAEALQGGVREDDAAVFAGHMLYEMARMSRDDGLVMQIHPGVLRDHDTAIHTAFGPDKGFDIPVSAEFTRALRPVLNAFGRDPNFRLILFTVDETVYSRELAPIAGVYPSVRLGAPWWFLDSPDGMRRFRELVTETAGFYNTSGFVDDTRAFLSIPARHDLARRIDAGYLARLVLEHRLSDDEAVETAIDLAYRLPQQAYAPAALGK
ncbi:glucuronate isomerase [Micromonospora sp. DR5-3]|uniref:glucuronate isomerase n=1 Tax=unclassified Micromonospora TaxID=2617518 RepID=UPI0011D7737A|nr:MULTISPECIES: glucuronate isomerase [unclassified Micromonospora]MCW3816435.1 glucuronate isomerase [Micromonospora sp. DR5-3]TYC21512.1 glucuronate isomerase [Micromonospora sp. MP36]